MDWDQSFTEEVIQSVEVLEATLKSSSSSSSPSSSSSSSLVTKRRKFITHEENNKPTTRRRLPYSIVSPPPSFRLSLSPCQVNPRFRYPQLRFGGQIFYSRTKAEVENAAKKLLKILEIKKKEMGQVSVGLDIEWKPSFQKGVLPGKAAVMQICFDNGCCHVMHIIHSGITPSLRLFLLDSSIIKVGVAIGGDAVKLFNDYRVSVKAVEDLSYIANQKLDGDCRRNWSLASLSETLVSKELPKPKHIRLGNWELHPLSKEQLQYAATDAFASWHLYQVLMSLPCVEKDVAADKQSECIPTK